MKKTTVDPVLLQLLVSVYNQSIQTYFYFPDVIICGRKRIERDEFERLLAMDFIVAYKADSFGRWYRLSRQGDEFLLHSMLRRKQKGSALPLTVLQRPLPFFESC